jgi:hypothetical protein
MMEDTGAPMSTLEQAGQLCQLVGCSHSIICAISSVTDDADPQL